MIEFESALKVTLLQLNDEEGLGSSRYVYPDLTPPGPSSSHCSLQHLHMSAGNFSGGCCQTDFIENRELIRLFEARLQLRFERFILRRQIECTDLSSVGKQ